MKNNDIICLYNLELTIIKMKLPNYFYFGEDLNNKICLNNKENNWQVYNTKNNTKYDIRTYGNCFDACIDIICRHCQNYYQIEESVSVFESLFENKLAKEKLIEIEKKYIKNNYTKDEKKLTLSK